MHVSVQISQQKVVHMRSYSGLIIGGIILITIAFRFDVYSHILEQDKLTWESAFWLSLVTEIIGAFILLIVIDLIIRPQIDKATQRTRLAIQLHGEWHSENMHKARRTFEDVIRKNFDNNGERLGSSKLNRVLKEQGQDEDARNIFRVLGFLAQVGRLLKTNNVNKKLIEDMFSDFIDDYILTEHLIDLIAETAKEYSKSEEGAIKREKKKKTTLWLGPTAYLVSEIKTIDLDTRENEILEEALKKSNYYTKKRWYNRILPRSTN